MAKARKRARKPAAKRTAKKRRGTKAKARTKPKAMKVAKRKAARRRRISKEGPIAEAMHAVVNTIEEAAALRRRLAGRETFED